MHCKSIIDIVDSDEAFGLRPQLTVQLPTDWALLDPFFRIEFVTVSQIAREARMKMEQWVNVIYQKKLHQMVAALLLLLLMGTNVIMWLNTWDVMHTFANDRQKCLQMKENLYFITTCV